MKEYARISSSVSLRALRLWDILPIVGIPESLGTCFHYVAHRSWKMASDATGCMAHGGVLSRSGFEVQAYGRSRVREEALNIGVLKSRP